MAGSLRGFQYISDDGNSYRIVRDESNVEAVNSVSFTAQNTGSDLPTLPSGYEPRYALLYQVSNPNIKRKIAILRAADFQALTGASTFSLQVVGVLPQLFKVSSLIGERRERLTQGDTGQTDGDSDEIISV